MTVLQRILEERGLRVLVPSDLEIGVDWASEIQKQLSRADLVIGVITAEQSSPWVLFELGQASALGRRIVLIASPRAEPVPFASHQFLVIRTEIDNEEAIGFALDQVLSAPKISHRERSTHPSSLKALGQKTDKFVSRLDRHIRAKEWRFVEELVVDVLRASGTDLVIKSPNGDHGPDIAVWSDVLEPFVGNPLLIEVKGEFKRRADVNFATSQLAKHVGASGSKWGVLLFGAGPDVDEEVLAASPINILVISIRSLLDLLRVQAFPEVVRDLRNRRVHGVR